MGRIIRIRHSLSGQWRLWLVQAFRDLFKRKVFLEDWAKQTATIKYVYLLELRPDEKNWDGFILNEEQLIPTAQETWAGIKVVVILHTYSQIWVVYLL